MADSKSNSQRSNLQNTRSKPNSDKHKKKNTDKKQNKNSKEKSNIKQANSQIIIKTGQKQALVEMILEQAKSKFSVQTKRASAEARLIIDTLVGTFTGFTLSFFVLPMDKAVIQNMNGIATIKQSLIQSSKQMLRFVLI